MRKIKNFVKFMQLPLNATNLKKPVWGTPCYKTQYIFRINKVNKDEQDGKGVSQIVRNRTVPDDIG